MNIRSSKGRVLVAMKARPSLFTDDQQARFLQHFSATCNLGESAAAAGVSRKTIYDRLRRDQPFADAFAVAEEHGVGNLRAELVRRSLALLQATTPDEQALASLPGLDCRFILNLLQQHERALHQRNGDRRPARSDASVAAGRLAALMERMGAERKKEVALAQAARAARKRALDQLHPGGIAPDASCDA